MKLNGIELRSDFGDPLAEARSCRQGSALFDFSFIQSVRISGARSQQIVEVFSSRSVQSLEEGKIFYAVRTDESGRAISDLTIWRIAENVFEIMSGRTEDVVAILDLDSDDSRIENVSEERAVLAVQGPLSLHVLQQAGADRRIGNLDYFSFTRMFIGDIPCIVGRLGYTGEAGFEVITARQHFNKLWKMLAAHARPAGFIAADMLRIEAGFVLFANEFRLPVSPIEAGLGKFHSGLERSKPGLKLITFEAETEALKPLPWQPSVKLSRSMKPGEIVVTSACRSISNGKIIGLGYIPIATSKEAALEDKSGVFFNISQLHMPFYDRQKLRPRTNWLRAANE